MSIGYCASCQMPLIDGAWSMINRKKYCKCCIERQNATQSQAKENDALKQKFFGYLLSLFPNLRVVPEHWYSQLEAMFKKGYSVKNIQNTLVYCGGIGKEVTEENWGQLVYIFYNEAVAWVDKLRAQRDFNQQVDIASRTVTIPFKNKSVKRDMPTYRIEDL